jgi:uncharacterized protein
VGYGIIALHHKREVLMNPLFYYASLIITGICTGIASGLFGVGGGFLMTPIQYWLYSADGMDGSLATRLAFGTSLAVILPTMISGALAHHARRAVNWIAAVQMGVAALFGGLAGGTLATHLPGVALRSFFALLIILTAIRMVWYIHKCETSDRRESTGIHLTLGFCIGITSGLGGIGGGVLLIPLLVILLGYSIHQAVGTSSVCLIFSSAGAVTGYIVNGIGVAGLPVFSLGYVDLVSFSLLTIITIPLAQFGARCAYCCSGRNLQLFFVGGLILIGGLMLASIF